MSCWCSPSAPSLVVLGVQRGALLYATQCSQCLCDHGHGISQISKDGCWSSFGIRSALSFGEMDHGRDSWGSQVQVCLKMSLSFSIFINKTLILVTGSISGSQRKGSPWSFVSSFKMLPLSLNDGLAAEQLCQCYLAVNWWYHFPTINSSVAARLTWLINVK